MAPYGHSCISFTPIARGATLATRAVLSSRLARCRRTASRERARGRLTARTDHPVKPPRVKSPWADSTLTSVEMTGGQGDAALGLRTARCRSRPRAVRQAAGLCRWKAPSRWRAPRGRPGGASQQNHCRPPGSDPEATASTPLLGLRRSDPSPSSHVRVPNRALFCHGSGHRWAKQEAPKWTRLESCVEVSAVAPGLNAPLGSAFAFDDQGYQLAATSQRCGQCPVAPTLRVFVAQLVDQSVPLGPVLLSDAVRLRCLRVEFFRARGSRL